MQEGDIFVDRNAEIIKDTQSGKISDEIPCPSWDYVGSTMYNDPIAAQFIQKIKINYNKITIPHKIGWTGYINFKSKDTSENGWCEDAVGRFIAQINGIRMFKRYQIGDLIMYKKPPSFDWTSLTHSDICEFNF